MTVQEVEVLAGVHHPNVVHIFAACSCPPYVFLVEEKFDTSLYKLLHPKPGALKPQDLTVKRVNCKRSRAKNVSKL